MTESTHAEQLAALVSIVASTCSITAGFLMVFAYRRYRATLKCVFNDLAVALCIVQMASSAVVMGFATHTLTSGRFSATVCDVDATMMLVLISATNALQIAFFFVLGWARYYIQREAFIGFWFLLAVLCGGVSVGLAWLVLYDGRTASGSHFSQRLAWCMLPSESDRVDGVTQAELVWLHVLCIYVYGIMMVLVGIVSFLRLRYVEGKYVSWAPNRRVIYIRFFGLMVVPVFAIALDAVVFLVKEDDTWRIIASALFPSSGCVNAIVFLYTEGMFATMLCGRGIHPGGFAQVVRGMACLEEHGQVVPSVDTEADRLITGHQRDHHITGTRVTYTSTTDRRVPLSDNARHVQHSTSRSTNTGTKSPSDSVNNKSSAAAAHNETDENLNYKNFMDSLHVQGRKSTNISPISMSMNTVEGHSPSVTRTNSQDPIA